MVRNFGIVAAGLAAITATPALAATYNLGALPANTLLSINHPLSPTNLSDTLTFSLPSFGTVRYNLFGRVPNATVTFFRGLVGSGIPITPQFAFRGPRPSPNLPYITGAPGNFYAVVTGTPGRPISYNLRLTYNPAPVPGPAGLLVFGAGAAALVARRRRAKAKAAA